MDARAHQINKLRKFTKALDPILVNHIVRFASAHVPDEAYCFRDSKGEGEDRKYGVRFEWEEDGLKFQTTVTEE